MQDLRNNIIGIIDKEWPIHISGIARKLDMDVDGKNKKQIVARISYHINQLQKEERIRVKKIDRALVAWPFEIEKLRTIHEILK